VLFTFAMLEKRSMPLVAVPAYLERVAILAEINRLYLRMTPAALAERLVADLERAGALFRRDGMLLSRGG
jgi:hypothetical protein